MLDVYGLLCVYPCFGRKSSFFYLLPLTPPQLMRKDEREGLVLTFLIVPFPDPAQIIVSSPCVKRNDFCR